MYCVNLKLVNHNTHTTQSYAKQGDEGAIKGLEMFNKHEAEHNKLLPSTGETNEPTEEKKKKTESKKKKQKPNERCACGSNKKYKKCCGSKKR